MDKNIDYIDLGKQTKKARLEPKIGKWEWVRCMDGYYLFEPPFIVNGMKIKTRIILDSYCTSKDNEYIIKYAEQLPQFKWKIGDKMLVIIMNVQI